MWGCSQVFEQFVRVLTNGKTAVSAAGSDEELREACQAWQADTLARLQSFGRRWHVAIAPLATRLDSHVVADHSTLPEIRAALLHVLYL